MNNPYNYNVISGIDSLNQEREIVTDIEGKIIFSNESKGGTTEKTLIANATGTGTGETINFLNCYSKFIIQLKINSGTLSAISCDIQASINGDVWQTIATFADTSNGGILFIINRPLIKMRASLSTLTGASPNISLYVAGVA